MWYATKNYVTDRWVYMPFGVALVLYGVMVYYGYVHIRPVNEQVFLRYTVLVGPSLQGEWWKLYYTPLYAALSLVLHFGIGMFVYKKDKMCARIFAISACIFQIFVFIAFALLISINF